MLCEALVTPEVLQPASATEAEGARDSAQIPECELDSLPAIDRANRTDCSSRSTEFRQPTIQNGCLRYNIISDSPARRLLSRGSTF
ncbi:hypothetical protein WJX73_008368 [Symbiochloris irregularis]|uniref:Uncharacterized protein n=1 Tax=Symbiochloris irregularis TaxID=706552 RepID=A0AAW1NME8_9CHLO